MKFSITDYLGAVVQHLRGFGLGYTLYMIFCRLKTITCFPGAKIIRFPIYFRKFGRFEYGAKLNIGRSARIDVFENGYLILGENVEINDFCHIACAGKIRIGNNALIASYVYISDHDHSLHSIQRRDFDALVVADVDIGDNVWIGEKVSILKGVRIGKNCVIGSGAVVTKDIPDNSVAAGVPANVIRSL